MIQSFIDFCSSPAINKNIHALWSWFTGLLNSNFFSALFGALAGALAAQKIADRFKNKEIMLAEMRANNAALTITFNIVNSLFLTKGQLLKPLKEEFDKSAELYNRYLLEMRLGLIDPKTEFRTVQNFVALQEIIVPVDTLQTYIYEKLSIEAWALIAISNMVESLVKFNRMIVDRNRFIDDIRSISIYKTHPLEIYFGHYIKEHNYQNARYPQLLLGAFENLDDTIFFGMLLIEILKSHGNKLKNTYDNNYKEGSIKPLDMTFEIAHKNRLVPHSMFYMDWMCAFHNRPTNE